MVFRWSLSDSKSPQVSRTLLGILAVLNNAVVWMFSTTLSTSKSSRPFINPLVTVPKATITIGIIVTFMFYIFFSILLQGSGTYPSFHFLSVLFCGQPGQQFCKLLIIIMSGCLTYIRWSVCVSKSHRSLCVLLSRTDAGLCIYHMCVWSTHLPMDHIID